MNVPQKGRKSPSLLKRFYRFSPLVGNAVSRDDLDAVPIDLLPQEWV